MSNVKQVPTVRLRVDAPKKNSSFFFNSGTESTALHPCCCQFLRNFALSAKDFCITALAFNSCYKMVIVALDNFHPHCVMYCSVRSNKINKKMYFLNHVFL